jgi:hypothetical protein
MKKILFLIAVVFLVNSQVSAQFFKFGLKTGVNFSSLNFDRTSQFTSNAKVYSLAEDDNFTGFHIGLMSRVDLFLAFIQPELYFNTSGGRVLIEETEGGVTTEYVRKITYNKIDLPILVGANLSFLRLYAGPVASVILSSNSEITDIIPELETLSKSATMGFQIGTGFDLFKTLTFDARYEGGLSKIGEDFNLGNTSIPFDSRASKFMFSVGFFF